MNALWLSIVWIGLGPGRAWAVDKSYSKALKHIEIKSSGSLGTSGQELVPILLTVVALVVAIALYQKYKERRTAKKSSGPQAKRQPGFSEHAAKMGFQRAEIHLLESAAEKVSPLRMAQLLDTDAGRHQLASEIKKRALRRERELRLLRGMSRKLSTRGHIEERASARVEMHLPVGVVPGLMAEEVDGEWNDVQQVDGIIVDLSEGGAALHADLALDAGDSLAFWSADPDVWLPPTTAQILHVEALGKGGVFHLQLLEAPSEELRAAISALRPEGVCDQDAVSN